MIKHLLFLFLILIIKDLDAQSFERSFGTTAKDYACGVIQTMDNGLAVIGGSGSNLYILKTDSNGIKKWSKTYTFPAPYEYSSKSIYQCSDSGYVFCADISYATSCIVKTDKSGNITWSKWYTQVTFVNVKQTLDGGYIAVTKFKWANHGVLLKIDASGNLVWSQIIGDFSASASITALDVLQIPADSSYIVDYQHNSGSNTTFLFSRFDKAGNILWQKDIGNAILQGNQFGHLNFNQNGDVVVSSNTSLGQGIFIMKTNGSSAKYINAAWPFYNHYMVDAIPSKFSDKGYIILSAYNSQVLNYWMEDILITRTDSSGNVIWCKGISGTNEDYGTGIVQCKNKKVIVGGLTKSYSVGYSDVYLVKTDSMGNSCHSYPKTYTTTLINCTLTPFTGTFYPIYNNLINNTSITSATLSEASNDACVCQPPVASFSVSNINGCVTDNSSWATKYHWWFSTGQKDSTTISPCMSPTVNGTYTLCLKVTNSCGSDSTCAVFNYTFIPVGIAEQTSETGLSLYPNPVSDKVYVDRKDQKESAIEFILYNLLGQPVERFRVGPEQNYIDLQFIPAGSYFLNAEFNSKRKIFRIIKQ